jgi:hypothetical protein
MEREHWLALVQIVERVVRGTRAAQNARYSFSW